MPLHTVVHVCPEGHRRATAYCGLCLEPCDPLCAGCGHDLSMPGHEAHP